MTPEILIAEGRRLERPCICLRPEGTGPVAALWHNRDDEEIEKTGFRRWITVDARFVPGLPKEVSGFISVFTDVRKCVGGRIEIQKSCPKLPGIEQHAKEESVLPPIEAVFVRGSAFIGDWLASNNLATR